MGKKSTREEFFKGHTFIKTLYDERIPEVVAFIDAWIHSEYVKSPREQKDIALIVILRLEMEWLLLQDPQIPQKLNRISELSGKDKSMVIEYDVTNRTYLRLRKEFAEDHEAIESAVEGLDYIEVEVVRDWEQAESWPLIYEYRIIKLIEVLHQKWNELHRPNPDPNETKNFVEAVELIGKSWAVKLDKVKKWSPRAQKLVFSENELDDLLSRINESRAALTNVGQEDDLKINGLMKSLQELLDDTNIFLAQI